MSRPPVPLVSVVLPTYNRSGILPHAMTSVLSQSFSDLELIVVDDGSTDDTRAVVMSFKDPRVRYVARERNGGVAAARNTGVLAARGRYLAFQDSDDEWLPEKLARQVADLQPLDDKVMSVCGLVRKGLDSQRRNVWLLTYPRAKSNWAHGLSERNVLTGGVAYTQTWLVPRQAVLDAGAFDERLCIWDDWDLLIRLSRRVAIRTRPESLVASLRGSDSLSLDPQRFARDMPLIIDKYGAELRQHPADIAALEYLHAFWLHKAHRPTQARAALGRVFRHRPFHLPAWRLFAQALPAFVREKAVDTLLGLGDRLLQLLIPPRPNRVAYVSFPDYTDNAFYVFRHAARTRNGLEHVWLVQDMQLRGRIERDFAEAVRTSGTHGNTLRIELRASLSGYFAFVGSRYVFHTHGAYRFRSWAWRRHIVCLWHGMPIKCIGLLNRVTPNPYPTFGTLHLATSQFFRDIIAASFGVTADAVATCSLPRCDALQFSESVQTPRERVRERLAIPPGQRLVLWLPTFRTDATRASEPRARSFLDDLTVDTLAALDRAAAEAGVSIVAKLHPWDHLNGNAPQWGWQNVRLLRAPEWAAQDIQLYDLLASSDALISDVSSVMIDYLVTGRPIGIMGFDPSTYTRDLNFPIDRLLGTGRFDRLGDAASIAAFLQRAGTASARGGAARFLYETFDTPGAEQVLRAVTLKGAP